MLKYLRTLYLKWRLGRLHKQLEARLRSRCDVVEIEVGELMLTSFDPGKKRTGSVNGQPVEFFHSIWNGEAFFPFWNERLQLSLSAAAPRPDQDQLRAVQSILKFPTCIRREVEAAILDHYRSHVDCDGSEDLEGKPLSRPTDHKRILKMLHGPTILPEAFGGQDVPLCFQLHFGCDWDEEHGVDVGLQDWQVTEIRS